MSSADELIKLSKALNSEGDDDSESDAIPLDNLLIWQSNVTEVNEPVFTGAVGDLPSGLYALVLVVSSPDNDEDNYRWIAHVVVP